ncbi:MAG: hypothetical protein ABSC71_12380, partial [Candidatus Acidiferrales bacterium]|jgi:hypothetical protein
MPPSILSVTIDAGPPQIIGGENFPPFVFPCDGKKQNHNYEFSIQWDLRLMNIPDRTDRCTSKTATTPGTKYELFAIFPPYNPITPYFVASCQLVLSTQ